MGGPRCAKVPHARSCRLFQLKNFARLLFQIFLHMRGPWHYCLDGSVYAPQTSSGPLCVCELEHKAKPNILYKFADVMQKYMEMMKIVMSAKRKVDSKNA